MVLRASLQAGNHDRQAAVATLQAAATQTNSTRLRHAIGLLADAIAHALIFAGPQRTAVPTSTGLAAAKIATETLPPSTWTWNSYGTALNQAGHFHDALAAYDQALALDPSNATAHINRGNTLRALGRLEDALAAHDQALTLDSGNAAAHINRGNTLRAMGRAEDALAACDQALTLGPGNATAHINRGNTLVNLGRFHDALAAYDQALALNPSNATAHINRGYMLLNLGRLRDALAACDQALALDPGNATAHANRGIALAVIGDLDQALAEFDTTDRLAPHGEGEGRTWAGAILWHRRDAARARDRFILVKGRVTGCTPFHSAEIEAIALCGLGQPDDAEQHLLAVVPRRSPGDGAEPQAIYDLLSDPALPGIGRLRAVVADDTWHEGGG
jgi:tetratricopeptide (TPR) repeat protein